MTDAECITRVLAGENAAFETLVRRHARAAYAVAFAVLRDADEAEDISQDAFVRAFDRLGQCRDPERFGVWLLRIVRNQSFKRRAWQAVRRTAGVKLAAATPALGTPEDSLQRSELRRTLLAALGGLREKQRTVILLYDLEGYSHREIAERIGISEMMSRRLLSDARPTLADEILAASRPAVLTGALLAIMAWTIGQGAPSTPVTQPIGAAHALGLSDVTAQIARQNRAPTLEQVLIVFGQAP